MNKPIEVLYAHSMTLQPNVASLPGTPVVRYSDHCARVNALQSDLTSVNNVCENVQRRNDELIIECERLVALSERLQAELTVAKYSQNATNDVIANLPTGRWEGKPKAL